MPLVIDAQILQTTAWDRGMGLYCRSLLGAYEKLYGSENITLIFNKHLPLAQDRKDEVRKLLPSAAIEQLDLPTLTGDIYAGKKQATAKLDSYLQERFGSQKVSFLILQLFTFDYCAAFPTNAHKLLICYDLIPLLYWDKFSHLFAAHMYFPHFTTIFEADKILAISETTKQQLQASFSIQPERIVNINGAYIPRKAASTYEGASVEGPFILMPSADMPHKNNEAAVKAFAAFNRELDDLYTLVITSNFSEDTQKFLRCFTDKIVFTGNIPNEELEYLYKKSEGLLFISSIEGLGLPILEAVHHDKPVICSTIDVFQEISKKAFYFCDPEHIESISQGLRQAILQVDWSEKLQEYKDIKKEYTWEHSAQAFHKALQSPGVPAVTRSHAHGTFVFPHPATSSTSLGQFVQSLVPEATQYFHITSYVSSDMYVDESKKAFFLPQIFPTQSIDSLLLDRSEKSNVIYFIDDTTASTDVLRAAILMPGTCYVTTKKSKQLLDQLADQGYITKSLAAARTKVKQATDVSTLLEGLGNKVYTIDIQKNTISEFGEKPIVMSNRSSIVRFIADHIK